PTNNLTTQHPNHLVAAWHTGDHRHTNRYLTGYRLVRGDWHSDDLLLRHAFDDIDRVGLHGGHQFAYLHVVGLNHRRHHRHVHRVGLDHLLQRANGHGNDLLHRHTGGD